MISEGMRILIVDDDPLSLELMSQFLQGEGHRVRCALSCAEAYSLLTPETFDILITDIDLGDGSGFEIAKLAKENNPKARIIGITGYNVLTLAEGGDSEATFSEIMTKPIDLNRLSSELRG